MPLYKLVFLLIGALLGAALAPLGSTSIAVALPLLSNELGLGSTLVTQLLVGGYLFICIVGQGPGGKLADAIGTTKTLYIGLTIFLAGTLLGFLVADVVALTISRMAMAVGTALVSPATQSLLRRRMPARWLSISFGIYGTTMSTAAAFGPWIGGIIVQSTHWSWVFALNIPVALLAAVLVAAAVAGSKAEPASSPAGRFDFLGLALLAGAVLCVQIAGTLSGYVAILPIATALIIVGLLIHHEKHHPNALIPPLLFQNRAYGLCCTVNAFNNLIMYSLLFQTPLLMVGLWQLDPLLTGSTLLAMTLGMMFCGLIAGVLINRFGPRSVLLLAQVLLFGGLLILYFSIAENNHTLLIPALAACGAGLGLTMPCVQTVAMAITASRISGVASGTMNISRYIGGAIGISLMTLLLTRGAGDIAAHQQVLITYAVALAVIVIITPFMPSKLDIVD